MINNRQGGGRRRGRGGQRGQSLGGQPGNRQDNRQRGNAAQLLEKYKSMARDSQLAGDRVQTEYYLQYADHYFRVLSESRSRFEEQSPRRQRDDMDEDEGDEEFADSAEGESASGDDRPERERFSRPERSERPERDRADRGNRRPNRDQRARQDSDGDGEERGRGNGADDSLPLDVLPPAIGADTAANIPVEEESAPAAPRRRPRARRPIEGDDEVAPAA